MQLYTRFILGRIQSRNIQLVGAGVGRFAVVVGNTNLV